MTHDDTAMPNQAWMHANITYMFWLSSLFLPSFTFHSVMKLCKCPHPTENFHFLILKSFNPAVMSSFDQGKWEDLQLFNFFKCLFSKVILEPPVQQVMMMVFRENAGKHHWSCLFQLLWYSDSRMYSAVFYSVVTVVIKWHNDWNAPAVKPCRVPAIIE